MIAPHTPLPWRIRKWSAKECDIVATPDKQANALVAAGVLIEDAQFILDAIAKATGAA